ncbi:MAG: 50S ribosomal protein L34 [Phycisphaerales bacterium]
MGIHYEKRWSNLKRKRKLGFRARMKTKAGRKMINNKRRAGRSLDTAGRK